MVRYWNSINFWQAIFCHFDFSPGGSILSLSLLFTVCMRLRGHSWKSSVVRHASGDKCFIWSEVYNQLFLSVEWKETEKKSQNLCRPDCLQLLSWVQYSSSLLISEKRPDAEKSQWKSSCGLVSVSGTNGFRTVPVCFAYGLCWSEKERRGCCSVPHKSRAVYTKRCTSAFWDADHVQELPALLP